MEPLWINGNVHAEPVQLANNQDNSNNNSRSHFEPFSNIQNWKHVDLNKQWAISIAFIVFGMEISNTFQKFLERLE